MPRRYRHIQEYEKEIFSESSRASLANRLERNSDLVQNKYTTLRRDTTVSSLSAIRRKEYRNYGEYLHKYPNLPKRDSKTECIYRTKLQTYEETRLLIAECIHFNNNERIQLKTKLTPLEKRSQFVA